jgi:UDP-N-acetylmuramoyl-L-alanyl-D-glutamate--2,6-diaminopimelate ligase
MRHSMSMSDVMICDITMDSRQVKPGDLFIAVPGLTVDGRDYIEKAIEKGAVAVLAEYDALFSTALKKKNIPVIAIPHLQKIVGYIAGRFFSDPAKKMPVIGITGTSGKTSISHFIAQILSYCHKSCGIIGTLGAGILDATLLPLEGTTPDAIAVHRILSTLQKQGAAAVAMEVTSHALDQHRVAGVIFDTVVFSNLTHDHLDYHDNMEAYGAAKRKLFTEFESKNKIINLDDKFGFDLFRDLKKLFPEKNIIGYGVEIPSNPPFSKWGISASSVVLDHHGIRAHVKTPWGEGELKCGLIGQFNLSNLLAAIAAVCIQDVPLQQVLEAIEYIQTIPGRMMRVKTTLAEPAVIIDYAHKPDALAQVLEALRAHCAGKLWCVVGCGGDRDWAKRPLMAEIGERLSDHLYLTQDNPRTEDPKEIMNDMLKGIKKREKVVVEYNRQQAIELAISNAKPEDVVLIAGKGHETYQIIGTEKIAFSDQKIAEAALQRRSTCVL